MDLAPFDFLVPNYFYDIFNRLIFKVPDEGYQKEKFRT